MCAPGTVLSTLILTTLGGRVFHFCCVLFYFTNGNIESQKEKNGQCSLSLFHPSPRATWPSIAIEEAESVSLPPEFGLSQRKAHKLDWNIQALRTHV